MVERYKILLWYSVFLNLVIFGLMGFFMMSDWHTNEKDSWNKPIFGNATMITQVNATNSIEVADSLKELIELCQNKSLVGSAVCVGGEIEKFYIYNVTDDTLNLTFDELKSRGGDCLDWAKLWDKIGDIMGFNHYMVIMGVNDTLRHVIAIWSGNEGYCVFDNSRYNCLKYL